MYRHSCLSSKLTGFDGSSRIGDIDDLAYVHRGPEHACFSESPTGLALQTDEGYLTLCGHSWKSNLSTFCVRKVRRKVTFRRDPMILSVWGACAVCSCACARLHEMETKEDLAEGLLGGEVCGGQDNGFAPIRKLGYVPIEHVSANFAIGKKCSK
jgi:hypothetical protein